MAIKEKNHAHVHYNEAAFTIAITGYSLLEAVQGKHCWDEAGKFPASPAQGESVKLVCHQSHQ